MRHLRRKLGVLVVAASTGGCLLPAGPFRMRGGADAANDVQSEPLGDATAEVSSDALDGTAERAADEGTDALDASDASDVLDASDASDVLDASDASDVLDASDVSDGVDASDASDVLDASDGVDVVDASDASDVVDAGDGAVECVPGAAVQVLDGLAAGIGTGWSPVRVGGVGPLWEAGSVVLAGAGALRSVERATPSASAPLRVGATWTPLAMGATLLKTIVRTSGTVAVSEGFECVYDVAEQTVRLASRAGGAAETSTSSFTVPTTLLHVDVFDDGATLRCVATDQTGRHISVSLSAGAPMGGFVAFAAEGPSARNALVDDLVYELGIPTPMHEYNFSEPSAMSIAIDRVGSVHGVRNASRAAVSEGGWLGRGVATSSALAGTAAPPVQFTGAVMPSGTAPFTVSVWVRRTYSRTFLPSEVFGNQTETSTQHFSLRLQGDELAHFVTPSAPQLELGDSATNKLFLQTPTASRRDGWTHVAVTRIGARLDVYVDGVLDGSATTPTPVPLTGTRPYALATQFNQHLYSFGGVLDELRTYDVALTPCQIAALASRPPG